METKLLKTKALPRTMFVKPKPMNCEKAEKKGSQTEKGGKERGDWEKRKSGVKDREEKRREEGRNEWKKGREGERKEIV